MKSFKHGQKKKESERRDERRREKNISGRKGSRGVKE